jgi:hypothetical protein
MFWLCPLPSLSDLSQSTAMIGRSKISYFVTPGVAGKKETSRNPSTSTGTRRFAPQVSNSKPASLGAAHAITALPFSMPLLSTKFAQGSKTGATGFTVPADAVGKKMEQALRQLGA